MPKARQAFAIFFGEHRVVQKGASRTAFAAELVELGKRWKALTELEKEPYKERSRAEFKTRKTSCSILASPRADAQHARAPSSFSAMAASQSLTSFSLDPTRSKPLRRLSWARVPKARFSVVPGKMGSMWQ